jgi:hypothetical protein
VYRNFFAVKVFLLSVINFLVIRNSGLQIRGFRSKRNIYGSTTLDTVKITVRNPFKTDFDLSILHDFIRSEPLKFSLNDVHTLQITNAENSKQIFPEKELRGYSPNFHMHVSVSDLYIPPIDLPILLQEICGTILEIYKLLPDT